MTTWRWARWGMLFGLLLVVLTGCPWLDDAAVASQPDLDARMQQAIAREVAKAAAEHRVPTEAELLAAASREAETWQKDPVRREAMVKALVAAGFKVTTGDPLGGLAALAGTMVSGYLTLRSSEALGKAGVRRYRRRKIAGTPVTT